MAAPLGLIAQDLVARATGPQLGRWQEQIVATDHCAHPIRLSGRTMHVDRATGEVREIYDTADEPDAVLLTACGNRRESRCPSCAATYRADAYQLVRAGLDGGKGVPDSIAGHPRLFVTFTAPSFGPLHTCRERRGKRRPCRPRDRDKRCPHGRPVGCWVRHRPDDPALGSPICLDCFDAEGPGPLECARPRALAAYHHLPPPGAGGRGRHLPGGAGSHRPGRLRQGRRVPGARCHPLPRRDPPGRRPGQDDPEQVAPPRRHSPPTCSPRPSRRPPPRPP
jgi:hypothetical protein